MADIVRSLQPRQRTVHRFGVRCTGVPRPGSCPLVRPSGNLRTPCRDVQEEQRALRSGVHIGFTATAGSAAGTAADTRVFDHRDAGFSTADRPLERLHGESDERSGEPYGFLTEARSSPVLKTPRRPRTTRITSLCVGTPSTCSMAECHLRDDDIALLSRLPARRRLRCPSRLAAGDFVYGRSPYGTTLASFRVLRTQRPIRSVWRVARSVWRDATLRWCDRQRLASLSDRLRESKPEPEIALVWSTVRTDRVSRSL